MGSRWMTSIVSAGLLLATPAGAQAPAAQDATTTPEVDRTRDRMRDHQADQDLLQDRVGDRDHTPDRLQDRGRTQDRIHDPLLDGSPLEVRAGRGAQGAAREAVEARSRIAEKMAARHAVGAPSRAAGPVATAGPGAGGSRRLPAHSRKGSQ